MASVDNRIVRLEFDNAAFERKMGTTLTSLDKLNKALKFEGAGKGLQDVSAAAGRFNMNSVAEGIEGVSKKFLALSTVALTVISNITGAALRAGVQLAKSLSLDQVIGGFREYETNMRSIQTVLANTKADGTNLEQVNAALDKLNEYSDKTIYNFGEMARNIGTFTAAGVNLDTSVQSIKGIANLAAISGSSSEQASTAMYQLSQAISTGTLKLMDWNSVTNAGMGGEVFQKALFESGKALKTIEGVPIEQTFEEWTAGGNSFRSSLEQGWLTSEVLTTTLQGFTGEMTEAQLMAKGFTKEQAANMIELGKTGVEAATKVRTLTQLFGTVKESIGSGWSASFRLLLGNFDEATELFTSLNNTIGGFIQKNADARNKFLETWAKLGGRMLAIEAIRLAFKRLGDILKPIQEAFRKVFPPITAERLVEIQWAIVNFLNSIQPSERTIGLLRNVFVGFFSALKIGWTVIKEGIKFIGRLIGVLASLGGDVDILRFFSNVANFIKDLAKSLVQGGGIADFFQGLYEKMLKIPDLVQKVKDGFMGLFDGFNETASKATETAMGRVSDRFQTLKDAFGKVTGLWEPFANAMGKVLDILDQIWDAIRTWFKDLASKIGDALGEGDFDQALDVLNVALLGGIAGILMKFLKGGLKIDIGAGFMDKITGMFDQLTGVLKAMQTDIKAKALLKIAGAIAILTASVLVLSLIDSAALSKALTAMAVGFGQLMGAFAILSKMSASPKGAITFTMLAAGMTVMAGAILLLSFAARSLASLSWEELAKGLIGVSVLLGIIVVAMIPLSAMQGSFVRISVGLLILAVALNILAGAVKIFATMSWAEMLTGFLGIAVGLTLLGVAIRLMPKNIFAMGLALLAISVSLNILAAAVKIFATMSWAEMAKGFAGVGVGLLIIGQAMRLMPKNMFIQAAGLMMVAGALLVIGTAMKIFGSMSWSEVGTGLVVMAGALLILAIACHAMSGAIVGAIAITIVAAGLLLLAGVIKGFAAVSWGDLLKGLAGIAIALAVLALAALAIQPAIPAMIALGIALMAIGAGFALFGFGASMVAEAFMVLAKVGKSGSEAVVEALKNIGKAIPALVTGLAEGLIELIQLIGAAAPEIMKAVGKLLSSLIDELIKLVPKIGKLIRAVMEELFSTIEFYIPRIVEAGLNIITGLLQGIRDALPTIVTLVGEIITGFLDAMSTQLDAIVQSVADLYVNFMNSVAEALGKVAATLLFGVAASFITGFVSGLTSALPGPMGFFTSLAGKILGWIGNVLSTLWQKGTDLITGIWNGINSKITTVRNFFTGIAKAILGWIGDTVKTLVSKGYSLISGFFKGIGDRWEGVKTFFTGLGSKVVSAVGDLARTLWNVGWNLLKGFWNGMIDLWPKIWEWLKNKVDSLPGIFKTILGMDSPSKVMRDIGRNTMLGFSNGMVEEWSAVDQWLSQLDPAASLDEGMSDRMAEVVGGIAKELAAIEEFNPVITPVLDLRAVAAEASKITDYVSTAALTPSYSYRAAGAIATDVKTQPEGTEPSIPTPAQVNFEQNIYAPEQLSTGDIYRQTRNQITLAKEELKIP